MNTCEELFSRVITNRKLAALDREILQDYTESYRSTSEAQATGM